MKKKIVKKEDSLFEVLEPLRRLANSSKMELAKEVDRLFDESCKKELVKKAGIHFVSEMTELIKEYRKMVRDPYCFDFSDRILEKDEKVNFATRFKQASLLYKKLNSQGSYGLARGLDNKFLSLVNNFPIISFIFEFSEGGVEVSEALYASAYSEVMLGSMYFKQFDIDSLNPDYFVSNKFVEAASEYLENGDLPEWFLEDLKNESEKNYLFFVDPEVDVNTLIERKLPISITNVTQLVDFLRQRKRKDLLYLVSKAAQDVRNPGLAKEKILEANRIFIEQVFEEAFSN